MILTLTGPSCAGKSTLENLLVERGFAKAISTTTRPMREGEVNGDNYYFVPVGTFEVMQTCGQFVESVAFGGNYYGLSVNEVERLLELGKPIVVVCEPVGQKQVAEFCNHKGWKLYSVFVDNPPEVIAERFLSRHVCDLTFGHDREAVNKAYASRLAEMMTTEALWRDEARERPSLYDLRLRRFDAKNSPEVTRHLCEMHGLV